MWVLERPRGGSVGVCTARASGHDQGDGEDMSRRSAAVAIVLAEAQERGAGSPAHTRVDVHHPAGASAPTPVELGRR